MLHGDFLFLSGVCFQIIEFPSCLAMNEAIAVVTDAGLSGAVAVFSSLGTIIGPTADMGNKMTVRPRGFRIAQERHQTAAFHLRLQFVRKSCFG